MYDRHVVDHNIIIVNVHFLVYMSFFRETFVNLLISKASLNYFWVPIDSIDA